jgi:predicted aspartyl protease
MIIRPNIHSAMVLYRWSLFLLAFCLVSDEAWSIDTPVCIPEPQGDWNTLILPFTRSGNLILIEAEADGVKGDFILDTGAPHLVLNKTYFREAPEYTRQDVGGISSAASAGRIDIGKLSVSSMFYENIEADLVSLSQLENSRQMKIIGLLGTNLFANLQLTIDLAAMQLILQRTNTNGTSVDSGNDTLLIGSRKPSLKVSFNLCDDKIFMPVYIAGSKVNCIIDTGAESNVVDVYSKKKVLQSFIAKRRINLAGSTGNRQDVLIGIMPEVTVGDRKFTKQQTIVTSMREMSETCSAYIDGILGYSFLSQGVFRINFRSREFSLYLYE